MEQSEVMTVKQVAEFLQLSRPVVYEYVKQGKIPAVMVGNKFRFSKRAVVEALERGFPAVPVRVKAGRKAPKPRPVTEILDRKNYVKPTGAGV